MPIDALSEVISSNFFRDQAGNLNKESCQKYEIIGRIGRLSNQRAYYSSEELSYCSSLLNIVMWVNRSRAAGVFHLSRKEIRCEIFTTNLKSFKPQCGPNNSCVQIDYIEPGVYLITTYSKLLTPAVPTCISNSL